MDLSGNNGRRCKECAWARRWSTRDGAYALGLVCVEREVWNFFSGPRDCAEVSRHSGPCGPDGVKHEPRRKAKGG